MKRNIIVILIVLLAGLTGCSDWLDVKPRTEIEEEVMFSTEDGFKTALNGVYILLAEPSLYGKNTNMYFPEFLAQHWTPKDEQARHLVEYDYTYSGIESLIDDIWSKYYTAIANLNNIIANIRNTSVRFSHGNDSIVRGEAIGLRGFLHLELLRFFGPVPKGVDMNRLAIPYVEEMGKNPTKLVSLPYQQVLENIIRDLDESETFLAADPLLKGSNRDLNNPGISSASYVPEDDWHYYRQRRFNYYAVKAAKARYYLWTGDLKKAETYAKAVIDAVNADGTAKFRLANATDYTGETASTIMQSEHLFGVINNSLQSIVQGLFKNAGATLSQTKEKIDIAYETGVNPDDIRYKHYWTEKEHDNGKVHHFQKYTGTSDIESSNLIPLLRLSEMHLILMECLPSPEALEYFKSYRLSRSMDSSMENNFEENIRDRLEKEYRKEFYGEGQMFFYYKRNGYTNFNWPEVKEISSEVYVIPVPQSQTMFE